ncbi:transposase [Burkholderia pseudomallei]|nr:transposase [Burkholderia pseudomallei]
MLLGTGLKDYGEGCKDVADGDILTDLLDQIRPVERLDAVGGDGTYDTKSCDAAITARGAASSISPREGAARLRAAAPGSAWRNEAVYAIAKLGRREGKKHRGSRRWLLAAKAMDRLKMLPGKRP